MASPLSLMASLTPLQLEEPEAPGLEDTVREVVDEVIVEIVLELIVGTILDLVAAFIQIIVDFNRAVVDAFAAALVPVGAAFVRLGGWVGDGIISTQESIVGSLVGLGIAAPFAVVAAWAAWVILLIVLGNLVWGFIQSIPLVTVVAENVSNVAAQLRTVAFTFFGMVPVIGFAPGGENDE